MVRFDWVCTVLRADVSLMKWSGGNGDGESDKRGRP